MPWWRSRTLAIGAYYVLVGEDGAVLGRFNLVFVGDGVAQVGYRVAQQATGRGVATAAVRDLCLLASSQHGVSTLRAATSHENVASQRVLLNAGFVEVGPADPSDIGGKQGTGSNGTSSTPRQRPPNRH